MKGSSEAPATIDAYIQQYPPEVQALLRAMRTTIAKAAPRAIEKISYRMPTFFYKGNLVHFAAFKNHIGFYPTASGISRFQTELKDFKTSRGAVQFPLTGELPLKLVTKIVQYRIRENDEREADRHSSK